LFDSVFLASAAFIYKAFFIRCVPSFVLSAIGNRLPGQATIFVNHELETGCGVIIFLLTLSRCPAPEIAKRVWFGWFCEEALCGPISGSEGYFPSS